MDRKTREEHNGGTSELGPRLRVSRKRNAEEGGSLGARFSRGGSRVVQERLPDIVVTLDGSSIYKTCGEALGQRGVARSQDQGTRGGMENRQRERERGGGGGGLTQPGPGIMCV